MVALLKKAALLAMSILMAERVCGQEEQPAVDIGGTIRCKYEYQTQEKEGRFEVRTARVNVCGAVNPTVFYKAEIDLCDEGSIKMLDAYVTCSLSTGVQDWSGLKFTIGQMRVPFTIDAHRSPDRQYFANRSFIAKQVGNVRDVGARLESTFNIGFPVVVEAGMYNGSGLTDQKDFWTSNINFSAKAQLLLPFGLDAVFSIQKVKPSDTGIMMYDVGLTCHRKGFVAEVEYLYKHYAAGEFHPVHAFDGFFSVDIPFQRKCMITKISPLIRYDFMNDHSDGERYLNGVKNSAGTLIVNDYNRSRVTCGVTVSLDKPFTSDIRLNYEKYFYRHDVTAKPSERDKLVIEFMTHF